MNQIDITNKALFPLVTKAAVVSARTKNVHTGQIVHVLEYKPDAPAWGKDGTIKGKYDPKFICLISQDQRFIHNNAGITSLAMAHLDAALKTADTSLRVRSPKYAIKWIKPDQLDLSDVTVEMMEREGMATGFNVNDGVIKIKAILEEKKKEDSGSRFTPRAGQTEKPEEMMLVCGRLLPIEAGGSSAKMMILELKSIQGKFAHSRCTVKGDYQTKAGETMTVVNAPEWMVKKNWPDFFEPFQAKQDALFAKISN